MKRILFVLNLSLLQLSCANLYSIGPTAIVEQPMVQTKENVSISLKYEPAQYFHLVTDASSRPLNISSPPELKKTATSFIGMNFGLAEQLEMGAAIDMLGLANRSFLIKGTLKYQILKVDTDQKHRVSLFVNPVSGLVSVSGDQDGIFGPGGNPWSASSQFFGFNRGISYGYQVSKFFFPYIGFAEQEHNISARVKHKPGRNDSPAASSSIPKSSGRSKNITIGSLIGENSRFQLAGSYIENRWQGQQNIYWGFTLGWEMDVSGTKKNPTIAPNTTQAPIE